MYKTLVRFPLTVVIALGVCLSTPSPATGSHLPSPPTEPAAWDTSPSPESLLNADGTLRLDSGFSGSLNLSGWNVDLDPQRGPVFSAAAADSEAPPSTPSPGNWGDLGGGGAAFNSAVRAIAVAGGYVYAGGFFTDVDNIGAADYIARWDGTSWSSLGHGPYGYDPSVNGSVWAIAVHGTDVYVGGGFSQVWMSASYNHEAAQIAKWDGSTWSALGNGGAGQPAIANGIVRALAVDGSGNVYAGGSFTNVSNGGTVLGAADYIAKWDGMNWSALGSDGPAGEGTLNATVNAIALSGAEVYAGGEFTNVTQDRVKISAADYIAKWDGAHWSSLGNDGGALFPDGSLNGPVYAIGLDSSDNLYAGGDFQDVNNGGTVLGAADFIAMWNGTDWSPLGNNGAGGGSLNGVVFSILTAASGPGVYAGGGFRNVNNQGTSLGAADYVAYWDGTNWSSLGSNGAGNGALNSFVYALALVGSDLFAGGSFSAVYDGSAVVSQAAYIAVWTGTHWKAEGTIQGPLDHLVSAVAVSGTAVYVAGSFQNVRNQGTVLQAADFIAKWDGSNWLVLGSGINSDGAVLGGVSALAVHGADVYAGGSFSHVYDAGGSIPGTCYLAKWDGTHWSALGSDGAGGCSLNSSVLAVAVDSAGNVYAGGYFTNVKDASGTLDAADYIAKWDPVSGHWSALGGTAAGDGSLNARVFALAANGSDIYAGGSFTNVENPTGPVSAADYVAKWDGTQWSALGSNASGNGSVQGVVSAVVVNGSDVYVGGGFQNVSNPDGAVAEADFVARWDGSRWAALGGNGTGNGSLNGWVQAIAVIGNHVYVGGNFANVADNTTTLAAADHIARWDGTHWAALGSGTGGDGSIREPGNDVVYAIAISGELLYAGGYFFNVDNGGTVLPYADYIAAYGLPRYTISGNARVSGAVLQYTDGTAKTATAAANGAYSFTVPYYWSGTVTPAKTGCTFTPASKTYSNVLADKPGEDYSVNCTWTYQSTGSQDGWMLESGENTNVANKLDSAAVILFLGDDAAKRQYRAVLSFPTSSLPDTAVITKATLKLNRQTIIGGGNPFSIFQGLLIDMRKGYFGSNSKLQLVDFKAASSKVGLGPFNPTPSGTLYTITLPSKAWPYLNKLSTNGGLTQLRLRFKLDDNNNAVPNYIAFYSGNAASAKRPVLTVTFHVP